VLRFEAAAGIDGDERRAARRLVQHIGATRGQRRQRFQAAVERAPDLVADRESGQFRRQGHEVHVRVVNRTERAAVRARHPVLEHVNRTAVRLRLRAHKLPPQSFVLRVRRAGNIGQAADMMPRAQEQVAVGKRPETGNDGERIAFRYDAADVRRVGQQLRDEVAPRIAGDLAAEVTIRDVHGRILLRMVLTCRYLVLRVDSIMEDEIAQAESERISAAIENKDGDRILELFDAGRPEWQMSSALGCEAAQGLSELGRNQDAIRVLERLEEQFPNAIRPKQLRALALARRAQPGDLGAAQEILGALHARGERDPETLGIYGRTWMDRYAASGDRRDLEQSRDLYAEAFSRAPDDHYTGINAAAKSVLLGGNDDLRRAAEYAGRVQALLGTEPKQGDYWATATIGEVFLIRRQYSEAARLYRAAVGMARAVEGAHRSTWTQACRLMVQLKPTDAERLLVRAAFSHLPDCVDLGVK
jgi:hypothetical protein